MGGQAVEKGKTQNLHRNHLCLDKTSPLRFEIESSG